MTYAPSQTLILPAMPALVRQLGASPLALAVVGGALGAGQALALTAMANLVVSAAPPGQVDIATGMNSVTRTVGMAVGSALSAGILATRSADGLPPGSAYAVAFAIAARAMAGAVACAVAISRPDAKGRRVVGAAAPAADG